MSYWISPCLSLALYGSLWLPFWLSLALTATLWHTLALSGSLLLSYFAYTALDQLTGPLLGSQRWCHDDALSPTLLTMTELLGTSVLKTQRNKTPDIKKYWDTVFSGIGTFCSGRKKEREVSCQRAFCQLDCTISGTIFLPPHSLKMQKMAIPWWLDP